MSLSVTDTNSAGKLSSAGCPHSDYTEKGIKLGERVRLEWKAANVQRVALQVI